MKPLLEKQSELSLATGALFLAGAVFASAQWLLPGWEEIPLSPLLPVAVLLALGISATSFSLGRRLRPFVGIALVLATSLLVLYLVAVAPAALRAVSVGLTFFAFSLYMVWFTRQWFARLFAAGWLLIYSVLLVVRFGSETYLYLFVLITTSGVLAELGARFKRRLEEASLTDHLCGVWNKRAMDSAVEKHLAAASRHGRPLSLMYIDLDDFKRTNDTLGHVEGDRVLQDFARQMERSVRAQDVFARLGGDEFALLFTETTEAEALSIAERLQEHVGTVRWSFGIAQWQPGESATEVYLRADQALISHKRLRASQGDGAGR